MKLTMNGYVELLSNRFKIKKVGDISGNFQINGISFCGKDDGNVDTVYVCFEKVNKRGNNYLYIVTHEVQHSWPGWYLHCEEKRIWEAVDACFTAFQSFLLWREKCTELAMIEHDISALMEIGAQFLQSEMVIIDRDYRYDGSSRINSSGDDFFGQTEDMDAKAVENLYVNNPKFDDTFLTDGLVDYPYYPMVNHKLFYYNLRYDRLYLGRLLYSIPMHVCGPGFLHLTEEFSALVAKCYEFHYLRKNQGLPRYSMYDIWKSLLENKPVDQETAQQKLQFMDWKKDHRYRIYHLLSNGYSRSEETLKFYAAQLEQSFPACIAAQLDDGIYMIHNLDREEDADFRQKLADFLRENLFVSGISNEFLDFYDSHRYGCQAKEALQLGMGRNPSLWRHEFRNYQREYIAQQCLSRYYARDLCPQGLENLLRYDRKNPEGELIRTLNVYFQCRFNAAEAAKQLFIHRTTLFYRLNKIKQITMVDFEDPKENLFYQIALELLQQEQEMQMRK